jgi:hypothetical protein
MIKDNGMARWINQALVVATVAVEGNHHCAASVELL